MFDSAHLWVTSMHQTALFGLIVHLDITMSENYIPKSSELLHCELFRYVYGFV